MMYRHNYILNGLDTLVVLIVGIAAFIYKFDEFQIRDEFIIVLFSGIVLQNIVFNKMSLYVVTRYVLNLSYLYSLFRAWTAVIIILFSVAYLSKTGHYISREWSVIWYLGTLAILFLNRLFYFRLITSRYLEKISTKSVLIIGTGTLVDRVINLNKAQGLHNIHYFPFPEYHGDSAESINIISKKKVTELIAGDELDGIWITLPLSEVNVLPDIKQMIQETAVPVRYIPDISSLRVINHSIVDIEGMPVISLTDTPMQGFNLVVKWLEDKILAFFILLLVSPVLILTAIFVKLSSPGPIIYKQERVGWNGKTFNMYKFRSMPINSEQGGVEWGAKSKQPTKVGAFLRKTSIDEFPQFFNVLKGDMSIVGPRPERAVFIDKFRREIPGYMQKHLVKAGITGWAQVNGWRGDTDLHKRIEYDLYYIENWSLWFDIKIIAMTIFKGFINKNAY